MNLSSFFNEYQDVQLTKQDCPVCYERMYNIDIVEPCNHAVHLSCLEKHMKQTEQIPKCPLCRCQVTNIEFNIVEQEEELIEEENFCDIENTFMVLNILPDPFEKFSRIYELHSVHLHLNNPDYENLYWKDYSFIDCVLALCMANFNQLDECQHFESSLQHKMEQCGIDTIEEYCKYARILIEYAKNPDISLVFEAKMSEPFYSFCEFLSYMK